MARRRDRGKERYWRQHVAAWRRSDRSVRAYCADEGLSEPSFYAWKRALADRDRCGGRTTSRKAPQAPAQVSPFVPVRVVEDAPAAVVEVVVRGGRLVRVGAGFAAQTLRDVVTALEELPC